MSEAGNGFTERATRELARVAAIFAAGRGGGRRDLFQLGSARPRQGGPLAHQAGGPGNRKQPSRASRRSSRRWAATS